MISNVVRENQKFNIVLKSLGRKKNEAYDVILIVRIKKDGSNLLLCRKFLSRLQSLFEAEMTSKISNEELF